MDALEHLPRSSRRRFLAALAAGAASAALAEGPPGGGPFFRTRGVVLVPEDLTLPDWPERVAKARLTTLALHTNRSAREHVGGFIRSEAGAKFLERCRALGLQVEYELHALRDLLPRDLFKSDPELFRMDGKGARNPDANLCVHSERALEMAAAEAVKLCRLLRPTTGRYFLWGDDGADWCHCRNCAPYSASDQALILENRLLEALRKEDPRAQLAHLAYAGTLDPPVRVKPRPGIFLEFAPIDRRYDLTLDTPDDPVQLRHLQALEANLKVFGNEGAQALEYWLDCSRFSKWQKPAKKLPWNAAVFADDLRAYAARGIRRVTSFAVFLDADYLARHGEPPLDEYGEGLFRGSPAGR